jgi:GT2 family glycosyltransferase
VKIQLEELDLLQPWPTFTMRPGYYAVNVFVRMGAIPIGDVLVRPARKRLVTPRRLQRRIVKKYTVTLLKNLLREALTVGPSALAAIPEGAFPKHQMVMSSTAKNHRYVAQHILRPGGIPEPFRTWVTDAQQRQNWPLPPVTIAVCTRDRESALEACIANLRQLDYPNFDILLIDNSRDPIPAREIAERLGVGYVRSPIPGLSRARNVAIEHARFGWVAFIDDDCRPERNWLKELVRPTQDGNCRCVCGLVRPAQLENSAEITFEIYGGLGRGYTSRIFDPGFLTGSRIRPAHTWRIGAGANMLLHKAFAQSVGGFDTEMGPGPHAVGGCGEDTDFFYQVLRAGHNIHYAPRAVVHHLHRSSPKALRKQVYGYAVGHAAYHVRCLLKYRDYRSLLQLGWHLPVWFARNLKRGIYGKTKYPFSLVLLEARGTVAGTFQYPAWKLRTRLREWFGGAQSSAATRKRRVAAYAASKPVHDDVAGDAPTDPAAAAVESAPYDAQPGNQSFRAA